MRNRVHRQAFMQKQPRALAEQAEREQRAKAADPADQLYHTKQWKVLRRQVLKEQPFCVCGCGKKADTVDHIRPHDGVPALFYDRANLQSMYHSCHNRKTNQYDGGFGRKRKEYKPKQRPVQEADDDYFIV